MSNTTSAIMVAKPFGTSTQLYGPTTTSASVTPAYTQSVGDNMAGELTQLQGFNGTNGTAELEKRYTGRPGTNIRASKDSGDMVAEALFLFNETCPDGGKKYLNLARKAGDDETTYNRAFYDSAVTSLTRPITDCEAWNTDFQQYAMPLASSHVFFAGNQYVDNLNEEIARVNRRIRESGTSAASRSSAGDWATLAGISAGAIAAAAYL